METCLFITTKTTVTSRAKNPKKGGDKNLSPRTRENADEFSEASRTGKLIRWGVRAGLIYSGDSKVNQRLNSLLSKIRKLDIVSVRGQRRVAIGLEEPEGRQLLRSFSFNVEQPADRFLHFQLESADEAGHFCLKGFIPAQHLSYPKAATHVQLKGAILFVDTPGNECGVFETEPVVVELTGLEQDLFLLPKKVLPSKGHQPGFRVDVIGVVFLQEAGGTWVPLAEGRCVKIL